MKPFTLTQIYFFTILTVLIFNFKTSPAQNFVKITTGAIVTEPGDSWGCSWADYDNDGKLDLFVGNAANDFLFRGTGDSVFIKITGGQITTDGIDTRGSTWGDYDNDGDEIFLSPPVRGIIFCTEMMEVEILQK